MSLANITSLIANGTLVEILQEANLAQATRSANSKIVDYFVTHTSELFDWTLRNIHSQDEKYLVIQRGALTVLTTTSSALQRQFVKSPTFFDELTEFMSQPEYDSRLCGNFSQIINALIQSNAQDTLSSIPHLQSFLINHIELNGLSELLITLTLDCFQFSLTEQQLLEFSSKCSGPNGYCSIVAISSIVKQVHDRYALFNTVPIIQNLLNGAAQEDTPLFAAASAFELINYLIARTKMAIQPSEKTLKSNAQKIEEETNKLQSIMELLRKPETRFPFMKFFETFSIATPSAMSLFGYIDSKLIDRLIENPLNGTLASAVYVALQSIVQDPAVLGPLLIESRLLERIIEIFIPYRMVGHLTEIANLLNQQDKSICEFLGSEQWIQFVNGPLQERLALRTKYGGNPQ